MDHATDPHRTAGQVAPKQFREISRGLLAASAYVSPKYLYDTLGSKLFEAICLLPEYYLTRTEALIFEQHRNDMAEALQSGRTLIDLGAGNCEKAAQLFPILAPRHYVPVDISSDFLRQAVTPLQDRYPDVTMTPIAQDFSQGLHLPTSVPLENRLFFYPGSSIGNFSPDDACMFLKRLHASGGPNAELLVGVDLIKEAAVLDAAYDDALGVTAAFNLNVLHNLNRTLDADFNISDWAHVAFFNSETARVEMHVEARRAITVSWQGQKRHFSRGERIHTESSYKYTLASINRLLTASNFRTLHTWTDPRQWFAVIHAKVTHAP